MYYNTLVSRRINRKSVSMISWLLKPSLLLLVVSQSTIGRFHSYLVFNLVPMEVLQKPNETYFLMSLKQLQELYQPLRVDIYSLLNDMLNINTSNPVKLNENDQVIVLSLDLMLKVSKILKAYLLNPQKSHIVIDHILFSLVFDLSSHLSTTFEKLSFPLLKELYGMESLPERWEHCIKETDGAFGYGLGM